MFVRMYAEYVNNKDCTFQTKKFQQNRRCRCRRCSMVLFIFTVLPYLGYCRVLAGKYESSISHIFFTEYGVFEVGELNDAIHFYRTSLFRVLL